MPELPEVETVMRAIKQECSGNAISKVICNRTSLRYPLPDNFAQKLQGRVINNVHRRAKYIICDMDKNKSLIIHLGMSGKALIHPSQPENIEKHDHIIFTFSDNKTLVYNDARRFGCMDICATDAIADHRFFAHLGPEPLQGDFNSDGFLHSLKNRKCTIKAALMNQQIVAGLGNIYVCEAMLRSNIHPETIANTLNMKQIDILIGNIRDVLQEAIKSGGSTLKDYVNASGNKGYFQHNFAVYGRAGEACSTCDTAIEKIVQQGRSTFFCPICQR